MKGQISGMAGSRDSNDFISYQFLFMPVSHFLCIDFIFMEALTVN